MGKMKWKWWETIGWNGVTPFSNPFRKILKGLQIFSILGIPPTLVDWGSHKGWSGSKVSWGLPFWGSQLWSPLQSNLTHASPPAARSCKKWPPSHLPQQPCSHEAPVKWTKLPIPSQRLSLQIPWGSLLLMLLVRGIPPYLHQRAWPLGVSIWIHGYDAPMQMVFNHHNLWIDITFLLEVPTDSSCEPAPYPVALGLPSSRGKKIVWTLAVSNCS